MLQDPNATNLGQLAQAPDPWFSQFDPSQASPSSPYNAGGAGGPVNPTPAPPIVAPGTAPAPAVGGHGDPEAFRAAWYASPYPKTTDGLRQFVAANPQYGATITGSKGSKVIIGGQAFQAVRSAGLNGGIGPAWDPLGPEGGGGPGAGQPGGNLGALGYGGMVTPMSEFTPPSAEDALNSPGLQFALSENNRMLQNGAASKGTLLNGRFQQALAASNIGNALQGYGDVYGRAANTFGINYGVKTGNQDRPFNKYLSLAQLGQKSVGES
jgi:hypothetical protein